MNPANYRVFPLTGHYLAHSQTPTLSVIITNYNYETFVGAAIESVLSQEPKVQLIVVDDASTDGSRDVIQQYAGRADLVLREKNGGQGAGFNEGLQYATGDLIMFLDSDDFLLPDGVKTILSAYQPGAAIYHFRMKYGDPGGNTRGLFPPIDQTLASGDIVKRLLTTGEYDSTVTSGMVFSREALSQALPMDEDVYRYGADGFLCSTVPLYGASLTIDEPMSAYRLHTRQHSQFRKVYAKRARWRIKHGHDRRTSMHEHAKRLGLEHGPAVFDEDHFMLRERIVSLIIEPELHEIEGDDLAVLLDRAKRRAQSETQGLTKVLSYVWWSTLQIAPSNLRLFLIKPAIDADARPSWVQNIGRFIKRLTRR